MATKLRFENPVSGDTIRLGFDIYNSNNFADPVLIDKVEVYYLDPAARNDVTPDGRTLFATIDGTAVVRDDVGKYHADLLTSPPQFVVGNYLDVWHVQCRSDAEIGQIDQTFAIYPDLWMTSPIPIVYDFQFRFTPTRWRRGEKKSLQCEITPLVPRQSDLLRYYTNLAIAADITVSIEQHCGDCLPEEADLRLVVDDAPVDFKEKGFAFFKFDTTDLDCGVYDVWAKMIFGDNTYLSERQQIQLY